MSTVKNADLWTVTFLDSSDQPATPDDIVTWEVVRNRRLLDMDGAIIPLSAVDQFTTTQEPAEEITTGVFQLTFTPVKAGPYSVKAYALVGDVMQAVPATQVEVER